MTDPAPHRLFWIVAGFAVWSSAFIALYGLQGLGCGLGWPDLVLRGVLLAVLAAHLLALAALMQRARRRSRGYLLDGVALWTLWAAIASTLLTYGPALTLTVCAGP